MNIKDIHRAYLNQCPVVVKGNWAGYGGTVKYRRISAIIDTIINGQRKYQIQVEDMNGRTQVLVNPDRVFMEE